MPVFFGGLSLKQKLTVIMLLTIISSVILVGSFFTAYERHRARVQMEHQISYIIKVANSQAQVALLFDDVSTLQETANSLDLDDSIDVVCIYDKKDDLSVRSFPGSTKNTACPDHPDTIIEGFSSTHFHMVEVIYQDGELVGRVYVMANLSGLNQQLQRYYIWLLTALLIVTVLTLLIALALQRTITDPIAKMAKVASDIAQSKDYSVRAQEGNKDEVGQLIAAFNSMLDAVEQRDNQLREHKAKLESKVEERTEKLKSANQELEAFSYSVSHDLRAPLRAIDGFSQALQEEYADQLDDLGASYLDRVRLASQRMGVLIDSMLRLSRVTRQEMVRVPTDLTELCREILHELVERDPSYKVEVDIQPNLSANCDARLIRIVMTNLMDNAWKYSSKTRFPKIEIGQENGAFFVRDNGAGFDMRYVDKLFGAFQRLHTSEEFEGTGVGLATVARIVRRHGGDIWAESVLNQGATFFFTLPD